MAFMLNSRVHVRRDAQGHARSLEHIWYPYLEPPSDVRNLVKNYLIDVLEIYDITANEVVDPNLPTLYDPIDTTITNDDTDLRYFDDRSTAGMYTASFLQTHFSLPVWDSAITVTVLNNPLRVTGSASNFHLNAQYHKPGADLPCTDDQIDEQTFKVLLGDVVNNDPLLQDGLKHLRIVDRRMWVYEYDQLARFYPRPPDGLIPDDYGTQSDDPLHEMPPTLPLPPVPASIVDHLHYVVSEVQFRLAVPDLGEIGWQAFVEVETCSILYLRALVAAATGKAYITEPVSDAGKKLTPVMTSTTLYQACSTVTLATVPTDHPTTLAGPYVQMVDPINSNHQLPACEFDYQPHADPLNFSSVSGYFHVVAAFEMIDALWSIINPGTGSYFFRKREGQQVYVKIDLTETDAWTDGNTNDPGVAKFTFGHMTATMAIGNSTSKRVVLHEVGHALLLESANDVNFGFAHNGGDGLAAIVCDPGSKAPDRFQTFPWAQMSPWIQSGDQRRHDRDVSQGWSWHGTHNHGNADGYAYESEQILSTTLFNAYRAAGGDAVSNDPWIERAKRQFASDFLTYLFFHAVSGLTHHGAYGMKSAEDLANALMYADIAQPGLPGHAYGTFLKVIRWAFEKQGLYQIAPVINAPGDPPPVDIYIDDGRDGDYEYLDNFWNTTDIWNRRKHDGKLSHQTPIIGKPNYLYVRVKNRGSAPANEFTIQTFSAAPGTGLVWPSSWTPLTLQILVETPVPSKGEVIAGPFQWIPSHPWHECLLAIVSTFDDPSNVEPVALPSGLGPTPHWQLVPFDNNIAQRNVVPVPMSNGGQNLVKAFNHRTFRAHNPYDRRANVVIEWTLPHFLRVRGWEMELTNRGGAAFSLGPNGYRDVVMRLKPGNRFTKRDIDPTSTAPVIEFRASIDGQVVGGMTYVIDPKMRSS